MGIERLSDIYKSRKRFATYAKTLLFHFPLLGRHLESNKYLDYAARGINIRSLLQCAPTELLTDSEREMIQSQISHGEEELRKLKQKLSSHSLSDAPDFTKVIWMYWDKGLDAAPEIVKLAHRSWVAMNPDYEIRFLDSKSVVSIADFDAVFKLSSLDLGMAHKTDYIRTYLLAHYGGVWADSTTFCWTPLSEWLDKPIVETGFFIFRQPKSRQDRQIANWFMASVKGNSITVGLFKALNHYLFEPRCTSLQMRKYKYYSHYKEVSREGTGYQFLTRMEREHAYPYHFYHYLFNELVQQPEITPLWNTLQQSRNEFVGSNGPIAGVLVSKQSYKGSYPSSETCQSRVKALCKRIDIAP